MYFQRIRANWLTLEALTFLVFLWLRQNVSVYGPGKAFPSISFFVYLLVLGVMSKSNRKKCSLQTPGFKAYISCMISSFLTRTSHPHPSPHTTDSCFKRSASLFLLITRNHSSRLQLLLHTVCNYLISLLEHCLSAILYLRKKKAGTLINFHSMSKKKKRRFFLIRLISFTFFNDSKIIRTICRIMEWLCICIEHHT